MIRVPRSRRLTGTAAVAIAAIWALASCSAAEAPVPGSGSGPDAPSAPAVWDGLTGQAREDALVEAAEAEGGTLLVYSSFNDEQAMADAFTEKYGIAVEVYTGNSESVLQRVTTEIGADRLANDVIVLPATDMEAVGDKEILGAYESAYRDAVSERGKGDDWTGVRRLAFVAGWNSQAVDEVEMPSDFAGFADPEWKGRLSMELSDYDWYATLAEHYRSEGMSDDEVTALFDAVRANSQIEKGHTAQGDFLAAGKYDVGLSLYSQTVDRAAAAGAPLSYGADSPAVGPVVVRYDTGAVMKETDQPATATLYLDFQLSEPGFEVDRELGTLPPVPSDSDPIAGADIVEADVETLVANRDELVAAYDALVTR